jgi:hypothetical protein
MFFDFTQNSSSEAMNLARQSVATHLKSMNNLFWNMILSREVRRAANGLQPLRRSELFGQDISPSKQLLNIFDICREPDINAIAGVTLGQIRLELEVEPDNQDSFQILGDIMASAPNNLHALVQAIVSDRGPEALDGIKKWLYDTGGLSAGNEPLTYSIVRGTKSHPHTWYYSMTDSTLVTLINLCYVEKDGQMRNRPSLELPKLVERLELRFGVLVNKPPKNLDSPEARQAAAENYQAFIGKLRNLGYFHGLSDEFDVQYVIRPERASAK